jgi:hypothetical protein
MVGKRNGKAGSKGLLISLFTFGISGAAGLSFFELLMESKAVFTFSRAWSIMSLLNEGKVNCLLIEGDRSKDEACDGTIVGVGVSVRLTSLAIRIEGLLNSKG